MGGLKSHLQKSGWLSCNPILSAFLGRNEVHGGSIRRNSSLKMRRSGEANRRSRLLQGALKQLRLPACLLLLIFNPSCTALTAVSAVPGSLIEVVANQFTGEEESFLASVRTTLAATQLSLRSMKLDVDLLEIQEGNDYAIAFSNKNLEGSISLKQQTTRLTTLNIKVRGTTREESVERAIINEIHQKVKSIAKNRRFSRAGYHNIREKPTIVSKRLGWFRPGARLEARKSNTRDWLLVKLPSGKKAYIKGKIKGETVQKTKPGKI